MTEEEFAEIIARGREQPSVELKGPGLRTDKHLFAKVVRAVLGMTNRRDGGYVIIGVEEDSTGVHLRGLSPEELKTWRYDDLADGFASYADPSVEFDVEKVPYEGEKYLVIRVEEFAEIPVLCKKGYNRDREVILRDGACYIRPRRKPETVEVSTYADMRDLIDLATEKSLRRFITRAQSAGIPLTTQKEKSDDALFDGQLEDFQMSDLVKKIKSRGYWRIVKRPSDFKKDRIAELQTLKQIVTQSSVLLRGWDFPHIDSRNPIQSGLDWVQQEVEWSTHIESWRFYQSGQFVFFGSISDDWLDKAFWGKPPKGWEIGASLSVLDAIFRFTEIFELAARLAMTEAGGDSMNIFISLHGLKNRQLRIDNPIRAGLDYPRVCHIESFPQTISVSRQELVAEAKLLALKASKELFERFDWTPTIDVLRGMQEELKR